MFLNLALMTALTTLVFNDVWLNTSIGIRLLVHIKQVFGDYTLAALTIPSLMLASVTAILGVLWIARRYRRNELSDQTFLFDASLALRLFLGMRVSDPRPPAVLLPALD